MEELFGRGFILKKLRKSPIKKEEDMLDETIYLLYEIERCLTPGRASDRLQKEIQNFLKATEYPNGYFFHMDKIIGYYDTSVSTDSKKPETCTDCIKNIRYSKIICDMENYIYLPNTYSIPIYNKLKCEDFTKLINKLEHAKTHYYSNKVNIITQQKVMSDINNMFT